MRKFAIILFACLGLVGVALYSAWLSKAQLLAQFLSDQFGVECQVGSLALSGNSFIIGDLVIGAPAGSQIDRSLFAPTIRVKASPTQVLFGKYWHIQDLQVEKPLIAVEVYSMDKRDNNWMKFAERLAGSKARKPEEVIGRQIKVDTFRMTDMRISLTGLPVHEETLVITPDEDLVLHGVGGGKALPVEELTQLVVSELVKHLSGTEGLADLFEVTAETGVKILEAPFKVLEPPIKEIFFDD